MNVTYHDADHSYCIDGQPVPSVTQVLKLAGLQAEAAPSFADAYYMAGLAGQYVHEACDLLDRGTLRWPTVDPYILQKVQSWELAKAEEEIQVIESELLVASAELRVAGRLDRVVTMLRRVDANGKTLASPLRVHAILDLKQSYDLAADVGVQLAGYTLCKSVGTTRVTARCAMHLKPKKQKDGTTVPAYVVKWYDDPTDYDCFRGAVAVAHWRLARKVPMPEVGRW